MVNKKMLYFFAMINALIELYHKTLFTRSLKQFVSGATTQIFIMILGSKDRLDFCVKSFKIKK